MFKFPECVCSFMCLNFFTESDAISKISKDFNAPFFCDNIMCDGSEEHILDCTNSEIGTHNCSVGAAAVLCAGTIINVGENISFMQC